MNSEKTQVELWLAKPVSEVKGLLWPKYDDGRPFDINAIQKPHHLVLHFPGGRDVVMDVEATTMTVRNGVLNHVALMPLTDPVPFHEATRLIKGWAESWGIFPSISAKISSWETHDPAPDVLSPSFGAVAPWDDSSQLLIEIKPYSAKLGWYVVLNFDLTGKAP